MLECKDGIREGTLNCILPGEIKEQYIEHQKAAVYTFSNYLSEKYDEKNSGFYMKLSLLSLLFLIL